MTSWLRTRKPNYDAFGLLLLRIAALIFCLWIGAEAAGHFPNVAFVLTKFGVFLSLALLTIADFRARKSTEGRVELPTK
jgi:hypothetical protein